MYTVKSWENFQHYSDRNPPWVKLHKKLLDDYDFHHLPVASRALAPMLWLLASEHSNPKSGFIEGPAEKIAFRLHLMPEEFNKAIKPLIEKGFIIETSTPLAECKQVATPETEYRDIVQRHKNGFLNGGRHGKQKVSGSEAGKRAAEKFLSGVE